LAYELGHLIVALESEGGAQTLKQQGAPEFALGIPQVLAEILGEGAVIGEQKSMAEIIRLSVDFFVRARYSGEQEQIRKKALSAAGKFRSGLKDLATAHDAYLSKAFDG